MAPSPDQAGRLPRATPNTIAAPGAALLGGLSNVFDPEKGKAFSSLSLLQLGKFSLPVLCWISFIQGGWGRETKSSSSLLGQQVQPAHGRVSTTAGADPQQTEEGRRRRRLAALGW